jgi:hypothetical protein
MLPKARGLQRTPQSASGDLVMRYRLRKAILEDGADLEALIARSARELGARDYTAQQIEGALPVRSASTRGW